MASTNSTHALQILIQVNDQASKVLAATADQIQTIGKAGQQAARDVQELTAKLGAIGNTLAQVGAGLLGIGAAFAAPFVTATKVAGDFEHALASLKGVLQSDAASTQALAADMETLRNKAEQLGRDTQFSATEAAQAMTELSKAGYNTNQVLGASSAVLDLAAASQMNLAQTAETLVNILNPFGLAADKAGQVANTLAVVANATTSNLTDLAEALKYAAPAAAAVGMSVEEAATAIGILSDAGIKGSMAGTALRSMLTRLVDPTKEGREALVEMGIEIVKTASGGIDLMATMGNMAKANLDLAGASKIFRVESANAALVLAQQGQKYDEVVKKTQTQNTVLEDLRKTMTSTFTGAVTQLKSSLEGLGIALGSPLLEPLRQIVLKLVDALNWVSALAKEYPNLTGVLMGSVGTIAAVAVGAGGLLLVLGGLFKLVEFGVSTWQRLVLIKQQGVRASYDALRATEMEAVAHRKNAAAIQQETDALAKRGAAQAGAGTTTGTATGAATTGAGISRAATAAGIGGAALSLSSLGLEEDLKGINAEMGILVGLGAGIMTFAAGIGAVVVAVGAWGAAIYQVAANWKELTTNIKEDLSTIPLIGRLFQTTSADSKVALDGLTQSQRDLAKSAVDAGLSWEQFSAQVREATGKNPTDAQAKAFAEFRKEANAGALAGKKAIDQIQTDLQRGVVGTQQAAKLTKEELKALEDVAKQAAATIKDNYKALETELSTTFTNINNSIATFRDAWQQAKSAQGADITASQEAFAAYATAVKDGLGQAAAYTAQRMADLGQALQNAISGGAHKLEIDALKQAYADFSQTAIRNIEKLRDDAGAAIKTMENEHRSVIERMKQVEKDARQERERDTQTTSDAIRSVYRAGMTEVEKYAETVAAIAGRVAEAKALMEQGGTENIEKAQALLRQNIQEAQQLKAIEQAGVMVVGDKEAKEQAVTSIKQAQALLEEASLAKEQAKAEELQKQKASLEENMAVLTQLKTQAEEMVAKFQAQYKLNIDIDEAKAKIDALFQDRTIKVNVEQSGSGSGSSPPGYAKGGHIGGYGGGDRIWALLEAGEFIIRKEAVRSIGAGLLNILNNTGNRASAIAALLSTFASGIPSALSAAASAVGPSFGLSVPHFAGGGVVDAMNTQLVTAIDNMRTAMEQLTSQLRESYAKSTSQDDSKWAALLERVEGIVAREETNTAKISEVLLAVVDIVKAAVIKMGEPIRVEVTITDKGGGVATVKRY